ncbi:GDP-6-deoxy-D-mannose reductase [Acidimicrobiaceae bacterium]|nr:GDP-6-deoxy-D-mannose reductase [Acidimicrobiaceae bacterium]
MKSVLVTGSDGFLGRHISRDLSRHGFNVLAKRRLMGRKPKRDTWDEFPASDYLVHLAGLTFVPASWENPTEFIQSNSVSTSHALNFCRRNNAKMIFLSTYLYSSKLRTPIKETDEIDPANPYALSKLLGEQLCSFYAKQFGVEVIVLRPFNVFGSGQSSRFLIPSIISQALKGDEISVLDIRPARDYIFIEDLLDAVHRSITSDLHFGIINVGTGIASTVEQLIISLADVIGRKLRISSSNQERFGEINSTQADISQAKLLLQWQPKWSLSQGLREVWNESQEHKV